jgi:hypothetical protein
MAKTTDKAALKGGKKGGAVFPRMSLKEAVAYGRKLVSKTHVGPLPAETIYPAVFGVTGTTTGEIKTSALKQFGLLEGEKKGYKATELARQIAIAPQPEQEALHKKASLRPKIFKGLYEVFQGDSISFAKIRQQCSQLGVHVDSAETCARNFIDSLAFAGLATESGDTVTIAAINTALPVTEPSDEDPEELDSTGSKPEPENSGTNNHQQTVATQVKPQTQAEILGSSSGRSVIHVNVTLDSSLDIEKLEKQLSLLRKFGAI